MAAKKRTKAKPSRKARGGKATKKKARKASAKRPKAHTKARQAETARARKVSPDVFSDIVQPAETLYDLVCNNEGPLQSNLELIACRNLARAHYKKTGHLAQCFPMAAQTPDTP